MHALERFIDRAPLPSRVKLIGLNTHRLGHAFADHDAGQVGVGARDRGHDRGIGNSEGFAVCAIASLDIAAFRRREKCPSLCSQQPASLKNDHVRVSLRHFPSGSAGWGCPTLDGGVRCSHRATDGGLKLSVPKRMSMRYRGRFAMRSIIVLSLVAGVVFSAQAETIVQEVPDGSIILAQTQGINWRTDRRDTRQDCRGQEGAVGMDKRNCKQQGRATR